MQKFIFVFRDMPLCILWLFMSPWMNEMKILVNDQLEALFLNVFILCLYMFRAASAHHQEGQIILIHYLV
jgi:hypothetical protein